MEIVRTEFLDVYRHKYSFTYFLKAVLKYTRNKTFCMKCLISFLLNKTMLNSYFLHKSYTLHKLHVTNVALVITLLCKNLCKLRVIK